MPEIELAPQVPGEVMITDAANFQLSPEPTTTALADEAPRHSATLSRVNSGRVLDDV
jgi:hypothetical protein